MKKSIFFSFCFSFCVVNAAPLSDFEKRAFVDFYRDEYEMFKDRSEDWPPTWVNVLFFDLNGDGQEEAIATCWINKYTEYYYVWDVYIKTPESWESAKRHANEHNSEGSVATLGTFEFYVLTRNGQPQLATFSEDHKRLEDEYDEDGEKKYETSSSFSLVSMDDDGYVEWVLGIGYVDGVLTEELDKLYGKDQYKLEPISPVTYTEVPAVKPEERAQLTNPETSQPTAPDNAEKEVALETSEAEDVPMPPPQNVKPPYIKKWLPVFVVVVLYAVWRVTRHRFQNKTRHPQPPTTE